MKKVLIAIVCLYTLAAYGLTKMRSVAIVASTIDSTPIGATTPSTGAFTTLSSTSGALNGSIGATTPSTGAFTTVSSTTFTGALVGNAATATKFLTMPTSCGDNNPAYGVDIQGNALCPSTYKVQSGSVTGCTTGSSTYDTCDVTVTFTSSFVDTNFIPVCVGYAPSDARAAINGIVSKSTNSVTVRTVTEGSTAVSYSTITCVAQHN